MKSGKWDKPSLKLLIFRTVLDYSLANDLSVILCNSNLSTAVRDDVIKSLKKSHYKTIGLFLNYSEDIINERIAKSNRDTSVLGASKSFENLVINQRSRLEVPQASEFDYFFEVTDPNKLAGIEKKIIEIVSS